MKKSKTNSKTKSKAKSVKAPRKLTYFLNPGFEFISELRDLVLKSSPAEINKMIERINKLGQVKLAVVSGIFIGKENPDPSIADLLIVGDDLDNRKLRIFLKSLEAEVGKEIKFALMEKEEFKYRLSMFDMFVRVLMEGPHVKLINKLGI